MNRKTVYKPLPRPATTMNQILNEYETRRAYLWQVHCDRYKGVPLRWDSRTDQSAHYADIAKLDVWFSNEQRRLFGLEMQTRIIRVRHQK